LTPFLSTFFDPPAAALPAVCRPLIQSWDRHLENARWRREEPTMEDYEEVLRIVAVVIQLVGGSSSAPPLRDKVPSRTPSSGASVVVT
jgi:preprotein translocase subunit Sss1